MPFFGLVWVASWVGCFFSSTHDLLKTPSYISSVSPIPISVDTNTSIPAPAFSARTPLGFIASNPSALVSSNSGSPTSTAATTVDRSTDQRVPANSKSSRLQLPGWMQAIRSVLRPQPQSQEQTVSAVQALDVAEHSVAERHPIVFKPSLGIFQNLLFGLRVVSGMPQAPLKVAVSKVSGNRITNAGTEGWQGGTDAKLCEPASRNPAAAKDKPEVFQIRVRDALVAETQDPEQATQIAQRLEKLLQAYESNQLDASLLQPALDNGMPVGRFGDRSLFAVEDEVARNRKCNPELLAIEWVNNLRVALAASPLDLADAQGKMHGLQATRKSLQGLASWYGPAFHGLETATGEIFDQTRFTAAHPSLPFDTYLKVTNLKNGKTVIVRINDRGPYVGNRMLDLSREAARSLDSEEVGLVPIKAVVMQPLPVDTGTIARKL